MMSYCYLHVLYTLCKQRRSR